MCIFSYSLLSVSICLFFYPERLLHLRQAFNNMLILNLQNSKQYCEVYRSTLVFSQSCSWLCFHRSCDTKKKVFLCVQSVSCKMSTDMLFPGYFLSEAHVYHVVKSFSCFCDVFMWSNRMQHCTRDTLLLWDNKVYSPSLIHLKNQ